VTKLPTNQIKYSLFLSALLANVPRWLFGSTVEPQFESSAREHPKSSLRGAQNTLARRVPFLNSINQRRHTASKNWLGVTPKNASALCSFPTLISQQLSGATWQLRTTISRRLRIWKQLRSTLQWSEYLA